MSVHVLEEELVRSVSQRAYLVGYLLGIVIGLRDALSKDWPLLSADIDQRLDNIYPLIEKEFYPENEQGKRTSASSPSPSQVE